MNFSALKRVVILSFVLNIFNLNAQIENEIMAYADSSEVILNNGKKLMMQALLTNNDEKASEIYFYLQDEAIKHGFLAFQYTDILYINLNIQQWGEWFDYVKNYENKITLPVHKSENQLTQRLYSKTNERADTIWQEAQKANLPQEELAVIKIFLHVVQETDLSNKYRQLISDFKQKYPTSKYLKFIDDFLPDAPVKSSWSLIMGPSVISPQGTFGDNFYTSAAFYFATDFNIGRVYASLYMQGGNIQVREPFTIRTDDFHKYDRFSYFNGGLQLGYHLLNSKYVHLAPYATIAGTTLESTLYGEEDNDLEHKLIGTFTYGFGLHSQFKIYQSERRSYPYAYWYGYYSPYASFKSYFALKINVGYNILTNSRYDIADGNVVYSQIGVVWGFGEY